MRLILLTLLAAATLLSQAPNTLSDAEKSEGWQLLFNGKDLAGWDGDPDLWTVQDGVILGSTEGKTIEHNTFLVSRDSYSDFVLRAEIKLRNHNSGIQFRSERKPDWVVHGYQADAAENNWWGSLYGEKTGRGVIVNGWKGKGESVAKDGSWNHYEIRCKGDRITITLNHLVTVDLEDDMAADGIIAFQLHRGPAMEASFRNVKIKKLD